MFELWIHLVAFKRHLFIYKNRIIMKNIFYFALLSLGLFLFTPSFAQNENSKMPITSLEFSTDLFHFGEVEEGEIIQNIFVVTNTGDEPLVIINAKGSCGCTVPEWPREPILPGESANFLVKFDSKKKGKEGGALHSKRVTITANTDPGNTYLTIRGKVFKRGRVVQEVKKESNDFLTTLNNFTGDKQSKNVDPDQFTIFPNPASELTNVTISGHNGKRGILEIFNAKGKKVITKEVDSFNDAPFKIDLSNLDVGTFTASLKIEGLNRIAKQFVVIQ